LPGSYAHNITRYWLEQVRTVWPNQMLRYIDPSKNDVSGEIVHPITGQIVPPLLTQYYGSPLPYANANWSLANPTPSGACLATKYNVSQIVDWAHFANASGDVVVPDVEGITGIPRGLERQFKLSDPLVYRNFYSCANAPKGNTDPTQGRCVDLTADSSTWPTLLSLSAPWSDADFFDPSVVATQLFRTALIPHRVNRTNSYGQPVGLPDFSVNGIPTITAADYFEPLSLTTCPCSFSNYTFIRSCTLNPWDVARTSDGSIFTLGTQQKVFRIKGLWICGPPLVPEFEIQNGTALIDSYQIENKDLSTHYNRESTADTVGDNERDTFVCNTGVSSCSDKNPATIFVQFSDNSVKWTQLDLLSTNLVTEQNALQALISTSNLNPNVNLVQMVQNEYELLTNVTEAASNKTTLQLQVIKGFLAMLRTSLNASGTLKDKSTDLFSRIQAAWAGYNRSYMMLRGQSDDLRTLFTEVLSLADEEYNATLAVMSGVTQSLQIQQEQLQGLGQLMSAGKILRNGVIDYINQKTSGRDEYRLVVQTVQDLILHATLKRNLVPFLTDLQPDNTSSYGVQRSPILTKNKAYTVDTLRTYYVEAPSVNSTDFVYIHQVTVKYTCNLAFLALYNHFLVDVDAMRATIGPLNCDIESALKLQCQCRVDITEKVCSSDQDVASTYQLINSSDALWAELDNTSLCNGSVIITNNTRLNARSAALLDNALTGMCNGSMVFRANSSIQSNFIVRSANYKFSDVPFDFIGACPVDGITMNLLMAETGVLEVQFLIQTTMASSLLVAVASEYVQAVDWMNMTGQLPRAGIVFKRTMLGPNLPSQPFNFSVASPYNNTPGLQAWNADVLSQTNGSNYLQLQTILSNLNNPLASNTWTIPQPVYSLDASFAATEQFAMPVSPWILASVQENITVTFNGSSAAMTSFNAQLSGKSFITNFQSSGTKSKTRLLVPANGPLVFIGYLGCLFYPPNRTVPCQNIPGNDTKSWYVYDPPDSQMSNFLSPSIQTMFKHRANKYNYIHLPVEPPAPPNYDSRNKIPMFTLEQLLDFFNLDWKGPNPVMHTLGYNPDLARVNPDSFRVYVARQQVNGYTMLTCLSPQWTWHRMCQILNQFRLVDDPHGDVSNPDQWSYILLEDFSQDETKTVTIQIPDDLIVQAVFQNSTSLCPGQINLANLFTPELSISFALPLVTPLLVNITTSNPGDLCAGTLVIPIGTADFQLPLPCTPTYVAAMDPLDNQTACWQWTLPPTITSIALAPGAGNLEVALAKAQDRSTAILLSTVYGFSGLIGLANQLQLSIFTTHFPAIAAANNLTNLPIPGNSTLFPTAPNNTNLTAYFANLINQLYNETVGNETALAGILNLTNDVIAAINNYLENRYNRQVPNLTIYEQQWQNLVIRNPDAFQALLNTNISATDLRNTYRKSLDFILTQELRNVSQQAWECMILFGNTNLFGSEDNITRQKQVAATLEVLKLQHKVNTDNEANCAPHWGNWWNADMCSTPWLRAAGWTLVFDVALQCMCVGFYHIIKRVASKKKGCDWFLKDGFGQRPRIVATR